MNTLSSPERAYPPRLKDLLQRTPTTHSMSALQWKALALEFGPEIYSEAWYCLTRQEKSPAEAKECLLNLVEHQGNLALKSGRDTNLITAACDYFMHVKPLMNDPVLVELLVLRQKEEGAYRDELTRLFNRRSFNLELPREMERFRRFGQPFSLLMLDLDHFKKFNDSFGHCAGDQALRDVAAILLDTARSYDRVVRYGGEEFAIILPHSNDDEAMVVAERILVAMEQHHIIFAEQDLGTMTVSIGLACYPKDGLDVTGLVQSADFALYQAKVQRNSICKFTDSNRNHPRYSLSTPLPVSIKAPQLGLINGKAWDVSLSGLLCEAPALLPPATLLQLVLSDPSGTISLPLQAEVRRLETNGDQNYQMGVSFRLEKVEDQMKFMSLLEGRANASALLHNSAWSQKRRASS